jgi:hypothetical protein
VSDCDNGRGVHDCKSRERGWHMAALSLLVSQVLEFYKEHRR